MIARSIPCMPGSLQTCVKDQCLHVAVALPWFIWKGIVCVSWDLICYRLNAASGSKSLTFWKYFFNTLDGKIGCANRVFAHCSSVFCFPLLTDGSDGSEHWAHLAGLLCYPPRHSTAAEWNHSRHTQLGVATGNKQENVCSWLRKPQGWKQRNSSSAGSGLLRLCMNSAALVTFLANEEMVDCIAIWNTAHASYMPVGLSWLGFWLMGGCYFLIGLCQPKV